MICYRPRPFSRFINEEDILFQIKKNTCAYQYEKIRENIRVCYVVVDIQRRYYTQDQYDNLRPNRLRLNKKKYKDRKNAKQLKNISVKKSIRPKYRSKNKR